MISGLKKEGTALGRQEFTVSIAAAGGLGEGVEPALCSIDGGKADIDSGLNELRGDHEDGFAPLAAALGLREDEHDVSGAHAG